MKLIYLAIAPLVLLAQTFTLVINTKTGEKIRLATEDIVDMIFEEDDAPEPEVLATPVVTATVSGDKVNISWNAVPNASGYEYSIDRGGVVKTNACTVTVPAEAGSHTVSVIAKGDNVTYFDSEAGKATYAYSADNIVITQEEVTYSSIKAKFAPSNATAEYYCAIIPAADAKTDADITNYFNNLATKTAKTGTFTLTAQNLTASTNYVAAAVFKGNESIVFKWSMRTATNNTFNPGDTGSVFAYGCDRNSGWYDVDKIYAKASEIWPGASDSNMCWACSVAGCLQWWIDEYEKEFGSKPAFKYDIPATSSHYSTPIMDIMVSTFPDGAYDAKWAYNWFFIPIKNPDSMTNNGEPTFKADSPYKYGGFLERDKEFSDKYATKYTAYELFPLSDPADKIEKTFNDLIFNLLDQGVVEITVNNAVHSVICWGVDYVVKSDGTRKVTKMYIAENGSPSNRIGQLEVSNVNYVTGDVKLDGNWNNITSMTVLRSPRVVKLK